MEYVTWNRKNVSRRKCRGALLLMFLFALLMSTAAKADWEKNGSKVYYYMTAEDGESDEDKAGTKATGLQKIGNKYYYYFNKKGLLQTGWVSTEDGYRYFRPTGKPGTMGRMYTGLKTIGGYKYYFGKDGVVAAGFTPLKNNTYYFNTSKTLGKRGRAIQNKWKTVKGVKYYFGKDGAMVKDGWVQKLYYMDENGQMLTNSVTPDGYYVGSDGKKTGKSKLKGWFKVDGKYYYYSTGKKAILKSCWKKISGSYYYFDDDGARVTGWKTIGQYRYHFTSKGVKQTGLQKISGKQYYFDDRGRLLINTTYNGYRMDENGVATKTDGESNKTKILIIPGHGQGDPGAVSSWGQERNFTRQFANLIVQELKSRKDIEVTYYKNGNINYDCYQQNAKTMGSSGANISTLITGKGSVKKRVQNALRTNSNLPDFTEYDYVLEIHFNAKGAKDPQGDGHYTGIGFYLNSYKSKFTLERKILGKINALGFPSWGTGVFQSPTLFNARVCQELGVSYGLLETAFIDDGDDMKFYTNNKNKMAKAVADAIVEYFG